MMLGGLLEPEVLHVRQRGFCKTYSQNDTGNHSIEEAPSLKVADKFSG